MVGAKPQVAASISQTVSGGCWELSRGAGYLDLGPGISAGIDHDGVETFVVEVIGSSVDRMANLRR